MSCRWGGPAGPVSWEELGRFVLEMASPSDLKGTGGKWAIHDSHNSQSNKDVSDIVGNMLHLW